MFLQVSQNQIKKYLWMIQILIQNLCEVILEVFTTNHNFEIQLRDFWTTTDQIMVVEIKWSFFIFHFSPMNRVPRPKRSCQLQMLPPSTTIKLKGGLVIFQTYRQMCVEILAHPSVCTGNKVSVSHSLRGSKMFWHLSLRENQNCCSCFCLWIASSVRQPVCFQQLPSVILPPIFQHRHPAVEVWGLKFLEL